MKENPCTKIMMRILLTISIIIILLLCTFSLVRHFVLSHRLVRGFYPLSEAMSASGYHSVSETFFTATHFGVDIDIEFDFSAGICRKNDYTFSLDGAFQKTNFGYFVNEAFLETVLNGDLRVYCDKIGFTPSRYTDDDWISASELVAHAGGAVRAENYNTYYTNSLEALVENYGLGHRVFEFDFYLTSDGQLAAVHDWEQFGHCDGTWLSSAEWKEFEAFGSPVTDGRYTTMMLSDVLDQMTINKDMFIVTDTKSFELSEEQVKVQFSLIADEATKRDPKLLDRIIPQVYNAKTYNYIMSVYNFPSVIYTTYATTIPAEDIITFATEHNNIKVITAHYNDKRFDEATINELHDKGLLIYTHTINTYEQLCDCKARKMDGFYTDLLLPQNIEAYNKSVDVGTD